MHAKKSSKSQKPWKFKRAKGTEHRAQNKESKEHRAQSTGYRAQSQEQNLSIHVPNVPKVPQVPWWSKEQREK